MDNHHLSRLPAIAKEIVEIEGCGWDCLLRLVRRYGGTSIRVPGRHGLEFVLTRSQYRAFVHHFRGVVDVPRLRGEIRAVLSRAMRGQGYKVHQIASALGASERSIYQDLAREKPHEAQVRGGLQ